MVDHPGRRGLKLGGDTPPLRVAARQEGGLGGKYGGEDASGSISWLIIPECAD